MPVPLYADVHVPQAITDQLRRRDVDVLTAIEDSMAELSDDHLLEHCTKLGRVMATFGLKPWPRIGRVKYANSAV
jgi:hypothetical protein